jgi:hypothetical protein
MFSKKKEKTVLYRQVFSTPQGRAVLTDMLNDLGFFNMHRESEQDIIRSNYARELLEKIGIWQPRNMYDITDAFMGIKWDYKDHLQEDDY